MERALAATENVATIWFHGASGKPRQNTTSSAQRNPEGGGRCGGKKMPASGKEEQLGRGLAYGTVSPMRSAAKGFEIVTPFTTSPAFMSSVQITLQPEACALAASARTALGA